jgi:hypothetical protein
VVGIRLEKKKQRSVESPRNERFRQLPKASEILQVGARASHHVFDQWRLVLAIKEKGTADESANRST